YGTGKPVGVDDLALLPNENRALAYNNLGQRLAQANEFRQAWKLFSSRGALIPERPRQPLETWEMDAAFATVNWDELRRMDRSGGVFELNTSDALYSLEMVGAQLIPPIRRFGSGIFLYHDKKDDDTQLRRFAVAVVLAHGREGLSAADSAIVNEA